MPYVDHALRELRLKVVYYGAGLGGKTSNLRWLHEHSDPSRRGRLLSVDTEGERTLLFDLLPMELGRFRGYNVRLHLCTVPGQIAQDASRRLVLRSADAVVFVVDSQVERLAANHESFDNLRENLRLQGADPETFPLVVQYNKCDLENSEAPSFWARELGISQGTPQRAAAAGMGIGVFETLREIIWSCLRRLDQPAQHDGGRLPLSPPGLRGDVPGEG